MAESNTVVGLSSDPASLKKSISIAKANGGTTVYETNKDIIVTNLNEYSTTQRIQNTYSNVTNSTSFITNSPAGPTNGLIQFFKDGDFGGNTSLIYNESTSVLSATGTITATAFTSPGGSMLTKSLAVANTSSLYDLEVTHTSNLGDISTITILGNSGALTAAGNVGQAQNFLQSDGAGHLTWATVNYPNVANLGNYASNVVVNAQPNITSVGNTLLIGNINLRGDTNSSNIVATTDQSLSIGSANGDGNLYLVEFKADGQIALPPSSTGQTVVISTANINIKPGANTFQFSTDGDSNLSNNVTANYFTGTLRTNAQPNVTSLGYLANLTVTANASLAAAGTGNIKADNIDAGNLLTANYATYANVVTSDQANIANLFVTANANIVKLNANDASISGNVVISGNLFIGGNASYINTDSLLVTDPTITLGGGANGTSLVVNDGKDRGTVLTYYTTNQLDAFMGWKNANSEFVFASDVSMSAGIATINTLANVRVGNLFGNLIGNLVGNISNGTSNVTIYGSGANVGISVNSVSNVLLVTDTTVITTGNANVTGNLKAENIDGGNLVQANYITGVLVNGTSNITVQNGGNVNITAGGTANVLQVTSVSANVTGELYTSGNSIAAGFIGPLFNGTSNVTVNTGGNVNITAAGNTSLVVTDTGANVTGTANITGNLSAGNINGGNLVQGNYFTGEYINGTSNIVISQNANVAISVAGTSNVMVISDVDANVNGDIISSGTVKAPTVRANSVTTTATTTDLFNTVATTINFGGAATTVAIGATTGNTNIKNKLLVDNDIITTQTTINVLNANATTVNFAGDSTLTKIGASTGNVTISNALVVTANTDANNFIAAANITANSYVLANNATITNDLGANNVNVTSNVNTANLSATGWANVTGNLTSGNANAGNLLLVKYANIAKNLNVSEKSNLNAVGNVTITGGSNLQFLQTDGAGNLKWANITWGNSTTGLTDKTGANGPTYIALGQSAGSGTETISLGKNAGAGSMGGGSIAIGSGAAAGGTGGGSIAIGENAASGGIVAGAIEINATGTGLNPVTAGLFMKPIRSLGSITNGDHTTNGFTVQLWYNPTTGEIGAFTP
jgi:hypothetical protein